MNKLSPFDGIEQDANPHDYDPAEVPEPAFDEHRAKRRLKIELKDLGKYGYSRGCPKCLLYSRGKHRLAVRQRHSQGCRARIYQKMRDAHDPKLLHAEQADKDRIQLRSRQAKDAAHENLDPPSAEQSQEQLHLPVESSDSPVPLTAEEGIDAGDASFLCGPQDVDEAAAGAEAANDHDRIDEEVPEAEGIDAAVDESQGEGAMTCMLILMGTLQALGVDEIKPIGSPRQS